ncbi:MAG TPA: hypothetical protein VJ692_08035 [Nitrospiraceae bacterium]|nr:hypothetical protein [Nitrospiraceae bacterium]
MDWAVVTWTILLGMVGLLWVMALAVMQDDENREQPTEAQPDEPMSPTSGERIQTHQRHAA